MVRREIILEYIRRDQRGIEIGPYFSPLVPKAAGWNVLSLDVFDAQRLREMAAEDPNVPAVAVSNIEEVDLLGPAQRIAELVASQGSLRDLDFIVSSHNLEHLPDPIGFFDGCSEVLRPGGILSMAVPDKRACFDYFRPLSTLGSMLEAYFEKRSRPSPTQLFDLQSLHSRYRADTGDCVCFSLTDNPGQVVALRSVEDAYQGLCARLAVSSDSAPYEDCHCWTFTPNSLRLLLLDLNFLRLIDFVPLKIYDTHGHEFYVHLRNVRGTAPKPPSRSDYYDERQRLLHAVNADAVANAWQAVHPTGQCVQQCGEGEVALVRLRAAEAEAELQQARAELSLAEYRAREALHQLEEREALLDATYRSRSWHVTMPLRAVSTAIRRRRI